MNQTDLFFQGSIARACDPLSAISSREIFTRIKECNAIRNQIKLLRKVLRVDKNAYTRQKTSLPFFIGASFREGKRRMENLISIAAFTVDIDHCFQDLPFDFEIMDQLKRDHRILMMFRSPSGKGLKLVFLLEKEIKCPKHYSDFYRVFIHRFAKSVRMEEFVDTVTSDVTRVCFYSHDPDVYYNPEAVPVSVESFTGEAHCDKKTEMNLPEEKQPVDSPEEKNVHGKNTPNKDQYLRILEKLGSKKAMTVRKSFKVPVELEQLMPHLESQLGKYQMKVIEADNIQHGKKVRVVHGNLWAEVNIFYGRRGFSVVLTPKRDSDPDLGEVVVALAHEAIAQYKSESHITKLDILCQMN